MKQRPQAHDQVHLQLALSKLELSPPCGLCSRLIATSTGIAQIAVADRFTHLILDLHWKAIRLALATGSDEPLSEFGDIEIEGRTLVGARSQLVAECIRWSAS